MQLTSIRGSQFPWGHFSQINQNTWQRDLSRLVLCQIYSVTVVAGLLYIKIEELPSIPITHYLGWIGSMPSPTVGCLVRFLTTPFLMSSLGAAFEAVNSCLAVRRSTGSRNEHKISEDHRTFCCFPSQWLHACLSILFDGRFHHFRS
ncbi:hypothetical protein PCANC_21912 [Puccinia coronata f. sp. avenae]|uniref:Uncharacterized protein n=1 Tax=Puccinia coronata f. sp. avenae TaxID=200324 RepID=A0A2N5S518_9BASI|nr:hypothetical protein PCANC_25680 [Puccinia coronata f. sp. avenae]PLW33804.1 hypothetical protein PCANC_21912 [Puccinia coronata f. sp. avenae]